LDHQFDRYLDAIQQAIAAAGYIFDRHSLPWDISKTAAPVVLPTEPKTPQTPPRHLYEPGVILFRGNKKLLLLFLVGETPTGGIHRVAFQNALWQIGELDGWKRSGTANETAETAKKTLRIVGPTFSGSADSLETLLRSWMGEYKLPPQVKVVSGSANSIKKDDFLRKIDFHATTVLFEQAREEFYDYLGGLDGSVKPAVDDRPARPQIAWLSEAGTGSGQNVRNEIAGRPSILSFIFPLHISQLRAEAARQSRSRDEAPYTLAPKNPNLALPMGEAGGPGSKDIVPLFSQLETITMELALDEELAAIHRERIRYVGVSATDPQDRIFLVREIRKHCPNTRVFFILGSDLLYMHSERNPDFQGALVISPYPLFGLNQLWTYPFEGFQSREQFSTNSSQGIYNATLALLDRTDLMLEYGYPFQTYKEDEPRYPALWLGVVGSNGIWLVKAFKFDIARDKTNYTLPAKFCSSYAGASTAEEKAGPRLGLSGNYWSPTGLGVLLLIGVICLFLPLVFLAQSMRIWPGAERVLPRLIAWIRRRWITRVFGDEEFYHYRQERRINLMFCCACLLTSAVFISSVTLLPAWITQGLTEGGVIKSRWNQHMWFGLAAGVMLVLTLVALFLLVAHVIEWVIGEWRYFRRHIELWPVLVVGGAMITLVFLWLIKVLHADWFDQVFFFLRASDLTNGVSILLPGLLIMLAAFLSFFTSVRRLNLAERMPCMREPRQRPGEAPQFPRFDREGARSFRWLKPLGDHVKETIVSPIIPVFPRHSDTRTCRRSAFAAMAPNTANRLNSFGC
jgi:hypothetical protein